MKRLTEFVILVWFLLQAADGALRFLFVSAGLPMLVYTKDAILLAIFAYFVLLTITRFTANRTLALLFALILFGIIVGLVNGLLFGQVVFGAKIYLPFFIGFMAFLYFDMSDAIFARLFHIVLPMILVGLILNLAISLPWSGFEYELAGASIEGSRQWGMFGLSRLAGFGRSSFGTATELYVIVMLYLISVYHGRVSRSRLVSIVDAVLVILALVGVLLTTSKSTIFAMLLMLIVYGMVRLNSGRAWRTIQTSMKLLFVLLFLYGIIPPLISLISPSFITDYLQSDNLVVTALSSSYVDRMENMWPAAYDLMHGGLTYITGCGVGSIGTSQLYFEPEKYNPADNVYLYLFVQFGGIILLAFVAWLVTKINRLTAQRKAWLIPAFFLVSLLAFGATMNVIESAPLMISLGMLLAMEQRDAVDDH